MKPTYTTLFLAIALLAFPRQQMFAQTAEDYTFSIHIGTFVKAQITDFDNIRPMGFIYAEKFRNNLLQIYMGEFPTEASAGPTLDKVKSGGYPDAYVMRRNLQQGEKTHVIELASKDIGDDINWLEYLKAGPMYAALTGNQVKIATGTFDNLEEASQRLEIVKQLGFSNAKVSPINNIYLHEITSFEANGELKVPEVELVVEAPSEEPPVVEEVAEVAVEELPPPVVEIPQTEAPIVEAPIIEEEEMVPPDVEMIPESYDEVLTARSPVVEQPARISEPNIRPKVKRTSAIELQKVLKKEGTYTGSLDGYYGAGTKVGYAKIMTTHPYIRRYRLLVEDQEQWTAKGASKKDDLFAKWESLELLNTIANDLDPNPAVSKSMVEKYSTIRSNLYDTKKALSKEEQKAIIEWNTSLWNGLDAWTEKDPIHQKMTTPLKITYYQSMVLLEDYYMDKGFQSLEAKGLALNVLQTLVAPYLESYRK